MEGVGFTMPGHIQFSEVEGAVVSVGELKVHLRTPILTKSTKSGA